MAVVIEDLVEQRINRVLTQYRESPNLLHLIRTYLRQTSQIVQALDVLPTFFDLDTAAGHQLTLLGQRLGFPRCHCICNTQPVFGFDCEGVETGLLIAGFCDDSVTWADCGPFGVSDICINDDGIYRSFLKVRRYQMLSLYDTQSLEECINLFFGPTAQIMDAGNRRVVIAPGRQLNDSETALLQVYPRVLPVAAGVNVRFHFGSPIAFGFGEGWGGFCDPFEDEGILLDGDGVPITDENSDSITLGPISRDAEWMCEVDPRPYDCAA